MTTKKTNRRQLFERWANNRGPLILRAPSQPGPLFLKPSFAISAQPGGLTVNVSVRAEVDAARKPV